MAGAGGIFWALHDPERGAAMAEAAREVVGPQAVAFVEQWAFTAQDLAQQARYQTTGAAPTISWAAPAISAAPAQITAPTSTRPLAISPALAAEPDAPGQAQALDWSPLVTLPDGTPVIERALVSPDQQRPYVQAALVRMDLSRSQLHLIAGTLEPKSSLVQKRPGMIPVADQQASQLLAAFNGGFRAINGQFGMLSEGATWLPPKDGLATLAIYRDGHVRMGTWGDDINPDPMIVAYRQNCPLLLTNGEPTPEAARSDKALWGKTITNQTTTWRSGLGLSADGRYLIYAVGDGLTVPTLTTALSDAGASMGMQLDINKFYTRFDTYEVDSNGQLLAQKLIDQMQGNATQYLKPNSRDFFYLTVR